MNNPFSVGDKVLFNGFAIKNLICTARSVGPFFCAVTPDIDPGQMYYARHNHLTKLNTSIR